MLRALDGPGENLPRALRPVVGDDRINRLEPLARLDRVDVGSGAVRAGGLDLIRHALCAVKLLVNGRQATIPPA